MINVAVMLRHELHKLAELENTRSVFLCGLYEIMRMLRDVVKTSREKMRAENTLLRGAYQNGWFCLRPNLEKKCFEKTSEQKWTEGLKLGSHRLPQSWFEKRLNLDDEAMPKMPIISKDAEEEQSYSAKPGDKRCLSAWKHMLEKGEMTHEDFKELQDEPWFETEVMDFKGLEGLEEYKELMKTPAEMRKERGIDIKLTSQKQDEQKNARKRKAKELEMEERKPLRAEAMKRIRELKDQGYSQSQISAEVVRPQVGKGRSQKKSMSKKLRDDAVKKLKAAKTATKATGKTPPALPEVLSLTHTFFFFLKRFRIQRLENTTFFQ